MTLRSLGLLLVVVLPTACAAQLDAGPRGVDGGTINGTIDAGVYPDSSAPLGPPLVCSGEPAIGGELVASALTFAKQVKINAVWELGFDLSKQLQGTARFDPAHAEITATITRPDRGEEQLIGFFKQDASPNWALRYAPRSSGVHKVAVKALIDGQQGTIAEICFSAGPQTSQPFVRVDDKNPARLMTTDGKAFVPVGLNVPACPQGEPTYETAFATLRQFNFNLARVWAQARWGAHAFERLNPAGSDSQWQCGVQTKFASEPGNYNLDNAARADEIFANAQKAGAYIMWTLALHEDWKFPNDYETNVYAKLVDGCTVGNNCQGLWRNQQVRELLKRNLRYTFARWGAYSSMAIFELYNEADQGFLWPEDSSLFDWHTELAKLWKQLDVYQRPVTTSFAWTDHFTGNNKPPAQTWAESNRTWEQLPDLDLVQQHHYSSDQRLAENLIEEAQKTIVFGAGPRQQRPFFFGEIGPPAPHWDASDPNGYFFTEVAWTAFFFAEAAGSGLRWWLENFKQYGAVYVLPTEELDQGYRCFGAFSEAERDNLRDEQHFAAQPVSGNVKVAGYKSSTRGLMMVRDFDADWRNQSPTSHDKLELSLSGFDDGQYVVEFWPLQGQSCAPLSSATATAARGGLKVSLPSFSRGLGVRLYKQQ